MQIDNYVIMPNHIHIIFVLLEETGGASPSPTISDIVCAFKSQCVREDYEEIARYIYENPLNWENDELY